jgi:hypothetical protein
MALRSNLSPGAGQATKAEFPSRAPATRPDVDMLGMIAMLCGAGLLLAVLWATCGLDLSIGFF